jgi:NADPH2:quinone reductase
MNAVRQHSFGGEEVLSVEEVDIPSPAPHEVLVNIRAAGVNPTETYYRQGEIGEGAFSELAAPSLPITLGSDFAGVVDVVGSRFRTFDTGDRVFGTGLHSGRLPQGSYAEYAAISTELVCHLPSPVDFVTGGTVGLAGVTAWRALFDYGGLSPGDTCLIHGGSGGVGHIAVQLAARTGATVVTTAGSSSARECVRNLGADIALDYHEDSLTAALTDAHPDGYDVVVDHRFDDYAELDIDVSRFGGRIVNIGGAEGQIPAAALARTKELTIHFMTAANLVERPALVQMTAILERLTRLLAEGELTVNVARKYDLTEARDAQRDVIEGGYIGKLAVIP